METFGVETVFISLLSGLVGAVLATYLNSHFSRKHYRLSLKRDVLFRFLGSRHFLTPDWLYRSSGDEPYIALNQAFVAFDDSRPVLDALEKFRKDRNNNNIVTLTKAMADSAKVRFDRLNDDFITHPFTPPVQKN